MIYFIALLLLLTPIPSRGADGIYNTWSGLIWCRTDAACVHEKGHRLDDSKGWISNSTGFEAAIKAQIISDPAGATSQMIVTKLANYDNPRQEIYATLYQQANGDVNKIPFFFQQFYEDIK